MSAPREVWVSVKRKPSHGVGMAWAAEEVGEMGAFDDGLTELHRYTLATPPAVGVPLTARQMAEAHAGRALPDGYWESMHRQSQAKWQRVADVANATPPAVPTEATVWVDGETMAALVEVRQRGCIGMSPEAYDRVLAHMERCRVATEVGHG